MDSLEWDPHGNIIGVHGEHRYRIAELNHGEELIDDPDLDTLYTTAVAACERYNVCATIANPAALGELVEAALMAAEEFQNRYIGPNTPGLRRARRAADRLRAALAALQREGGE